MAHVTDGLVLMLDPAGYSSGQVWANSVASPADGAAQTAHDYNLGSSGSAEGSDPTHAGTYWLFGGDDYFTAAASATSFINGMHKAGTQWTIEAWWYRGAAGPNVNPIWDSGTSDQGGSDMSRGVIFGDQGSQINPEGRWGVRIKRDSGAGTALNAYLSAAPALDAWHHHAVSYTGGAGSFLWLDGLVADSNLGSTWDGTPDSPGTADPANQAKIGARGDGAFCVGSGNRIGVLRIYNRALTDAELTQNWEAERSIYGLGPVPAYAVSGSVRVSGTLLTSPRRVRVYDRDTGALVGEADSVGGLFSVPTGPTQGEYYIIPIDLDPGATDWAPPCANRVLSTLVE